MAFPTGSIADNTVYKIGNRAWVYDSTLGVWDKVADHDTNASTVTGTLGDKVDFPSGHVIQVKTARIEATQRTDSTVTYSTSGSALSGTLDVNGIYRVRGLNSADYLTIPNFSAKAGNLLVGWWGAGANNNAPVSSLSLGMEFGHASRREYQSIGYANNSYTVLGTAILNHTLTSDINNVPIHALYRIHEKNKNLVIRWFANSQVASANWSPAGVSIDSQQFHMTVMEIQQ